MITQKLKEDTALLHSVVEKEMFADEIFNKTLTLTQYKQLITTNYIFHALLEKVVFDNLSENIKATLQIEQRRKLPALEADIQALQIAVPVYSNEISVPEIDTVDKALGALYVMEGATLGGNVIVKHLKQTPDFTHLPFHYYGIYQEQTGPRWKSFVDCTNSSVINDNVCVQSAVAAFDLLRTILHKAKAVAL